MNAIDTNILVYSLDSFEPIKQTKAADLIDRLSGVPAQTVIVWQVAAGFLNCLRRWEFHGRIPAADVEANLIDAISTFPLVFPTAAVLHHSLNLSSRYSLSHWDSMLLAACIVAGVDTLYSEDLTDGMTYDSVTVVDPFV